MSKEYIPKEWEWPATTLVDNDTGLEERVSELEKKIGWLEALLSARIQLSSDDSFKVQVDAALIREKMRENE